METRYLNVISSGPLLFVRVPIKGVLWRDILKALTPVMHEHGLKKKDISSINGYSLDSYKEYGKNHHLYLDNIQFIARLDRAFDGAKDCVPNFHLYEWDGKKFRKVRGACLE
jgi:hypothetical protein